MRLAAVIITQNEETNIERCLRSVSFCDEVVVIDSGSTDRTREIARRFTDKVFHLPWKGYAVQKNEALTFVTADWVLSVDADEEVTEELRAEILALLAANPKAAAFSIPRKTIHFGRWIRHGGWYPNRLIRLFKKSQGKWIGDDVHEFWKTSGSAGVLKADLNHFSFKSLSDQVARNNRYSSLGASALVRSGKRFGVLKLFTKPFSKFAETYFLKRGFLDGYPGFIISVSAAYSVFLKWAKLWELNNVRTQE